MAEPAGKARERRVSIEEVAKKLSLWHTATFRPILTHAELEPILCAAGFVALPSAPATHQKQDERPGVAWREYAFLGGGNASPAAAAPRRWLGPRPRLPYPRVDGLHLKTYQAFLGAVEAYLGAHRVSNLFHVRCVRAACSPVSLTPRPHPTPLPLPLFYV
jgi:hypothetical protein|uniref:Uncharacterized protein n=1 Tax=Zea mays TaxID=4577 RepID=C0HGM8_MAIZE|nr:unknown [Zea mays]